MTGVEKESSVRIDMKDMIALMAREVARQVTDELKRTEIDPLQKQVNDLALMMAKPSPSSVKLHHIQGMFEGAWKLGVVVVAGIQLWRLFK